MLRDLFTGEKCRIEIKGRIGFLSELKKSKVSYKEYIEFSMYAFINKKKYWYNNIIAFEKQAQHIQEYAHKNTEIEIEGFLDESSWIDKKTNLKRYKTSIQVQSIAITGNRKNDIDYQNNKLDNEVDSLKESYSDEDKNKAVDIAIKVLQQEGYTITL